MGITIKDIAKECGVSVATVSMALSDKKSPKNIIIVRIMQRSVLQIRKAV